MSRQTTKLAAAVLLALVASRPAVGGGQFRGDTDPALSLSEVTRTYSILGGLHLKATIKATGQPDRTVELRWRRSDRIYLSVSWRAPSGSMVRTVTACDGKFLWRYRSDRREATRQPAPSTTFMLPDAPYDLPELRVLLQGAIMEELPAFQGATLQRAAPAVLLGASVETIQATLPTGVSVRISFGLSDRLIRAYEQRSFSLAGSSGSYRQTIVAYSLVNGAPSFTDADFAFRPPSGTRVIAKAAPPHPWQKARGKAPARHAAERLAAATP